MILKRVIATLLSIPLFPVIILMCHYLDFDGMEMLDTPLPSDLKRGVTFRGWITFE